MHDRNGSIDPRCVVSIPSEGGKDAVSEHPQPLTLARIVDHRRPHRDPAEGDIRVGSKVLGVLLAIAGLGYLFDSFAATLSGSSPEVSSYTFLGEFLLALWLVIRGRRNTFDEAG